MSDEIETLLRKLDRQLLPGGWHDEGTSDARLFYVYRAESGRLYAQRVPMASMDGRGRPATEILYEIARLGAHLFPCVTVGAAWSMEAWMEKLPKDAPLHVRDQFHAARKAREIWRSPHRAEARVVAVVLRDGSEAGLVRERDGDVRVQRGPQVGLVYRSLRLLCGLPEDDPIKEEEVVAEFE